MMIDLRSDTITRPTEAMQEAMLQAMRDPQLGDDTLAGDPVVRELELVAAALAGKNPKAIDRLFKVADQLNKLSAEEHEEAEKN